MDIGHLQGDWPTSVERDKASKLEWFVHVGAAPPVVQVLSHAWVLGLGVELVDDDLELGVRGAEPAAAIRLPGWDRHDWGVSPPQL